MTISKVCGAIAICVAAMAQQVPGGAQGPKFDEPQTPQSLTRFEGRVAVRVGGSPVMVDVSLKEWVVRNRQNVRIPEKGSLFVEMLSGGAATVTIGRRQAVYKDGDHFTVPGGEAWQVATENDTVVFRVLVLNR